MPVLTDEICVRAVSEYQVRSDNTVETLMMPWNSPTPVVEVIGDRLVSYREQFAPGAFERAEQAPYRVSLAWGHSDDFGNAIGKGVEFRNDTAGEVGLFRLNAEDAGKAREMIADMGLSVSFRSLAPLHGSEAPGALVTRRAVILRHLAVVQDPAYPDARVLAMREADEAAVALAEAQQRSERAIAEALRTLVASGATLPADQAQWLQAHPPATIPNREQ